MATTNLIASQVLTIGQTAQSAAFSPTSPLTLLVTATEVVASQIRVVTYNSLGQDVGSVVLNGTGTRKIFLEAYDSPLTVEIACLRGTAIIQVDQVTGAQAFTGQLQTSDFADAAITVAKLGSGAATLPKITFTGLKVLTADGVNSTGGDTQVTLSGTAVGDRVIAIFGHVKAAAGANSFLVPTIPTHFEGTITVTNKIVQKQAAGDLSANTYLFILAPATS
jgi:hypothetical protein